MALSRYALGLGAPALTLVAMVVLGLIAGGPTSAAAGEVQGLYQAEVPVATKDAGERDAAVRTALRVVVVKVTGASSAAHNPAVRAALAAPGPYLQQYRYENVMRPAADGTAQPASVLAVAFEPRALDELLGSAGLGRWSRVRPSLLLWLAMDRPGGVPGWIGPADSGPIFAAAQSAATERGVPLLLPLLDLEDRSHLRRAEIGAGWSPAMQAASDRYEAEAGLVGRLARIGQAQSAWVGRWTLVQGGTPQSWTTEAGSAAGAVRAALGDAADRLSVRFAQHVGDSSGVRVKVTGVVGVQDYVRALAYLESLDLISDVSVLQAEGDTLSLGVEIQGGYPALSQLFGLGSTFAPDPVDPSGSTFRLLAP